MQRSRSKPSVVTRLNDRSLDVKRQLVALKSRDQSFADWTYIGGVNAPPFQNSWTHSDPTEVTFSKAGYIKNSGGWIYLCGAITGGAASTLVFTLPQGCRPRKRMMLVVSSNVGGGTTAIQIDTTGAVTCIGAGTSNWNLSTISFRAEN